MLMPHLPVHTTGVANKFIPLIRLVYYSVIHAIPPPPLQIKSQTLYNRPALVNKELNKRFSLLSPALFICFNNTLCALAHNKIYLLVGEE